MVYELEKEHKKSSLMCKKKEELVKEIMRLEHNVNVMNERLHNQANAIKRYEQEARSKAIDDFAEAICDKATDECFLVTLPDELRAEVVTLDYISEIAVEIAKQLKGEK